jgi:hypothetical protein
VATDFYGGPATGVEDMFASAEARFSLALSSIDKGDSALNHAETLRELVWTLVVRTRALREQFTDTFDQFLDTAARSVMSSDAQDALARHMRANLDSVLENAISSLPPIEGVDTKSLFADPAFKDDLRRSAEDLVGMVPVLFSQFLGGIRDQDLLVKTSEEGQIKGLKKLLESGKLPETFSPAYWEIYNVEPQRLILGDGCIVAIGEDGSVGSILGSGITWQSVYLPISASEVLVARQDVPGALLSPREINAASAALSSSYIYASQVDDSVLEMAREIGKGEVFLSKDQISEIVDGGWRDLAKSN